MLLRAAFEHFLSVLAPPRCAACDAPVRVGIAFCAQCTRTIERSPVPRALFTYGGAMAAAVTRFKYTPVPELAHPLGNLLAEFARQTCEDVDWIVPVPLHTTRRIERGFNQAALLARPVARALEGRFAPHALVRTRPTPRQAELDRAARLLNVRDAFLAKAEVAGKRILLVDDVETTGATTKACAAALHAAGCTRVYSLVLAIAPPIAYP